MKKTRRYNFGLFSVRWGAFSTAPRFQQDAWDDPEGYTTKDNKYVPWVIAIVPPFHWPVRIVARLFGGWPVDIFWGGRTDEFLRRCRNLIRYRVWATDVESGWFGVGTERVKQILIYRR